MATTVETSSFQADLAAHSTPGFLRPLGHGRSTDGPAGVIGGLLTPVGGPRMRIGGGPDLALRTPRAVAVQRRAFAPAVPAPAYAADAPALEPPESPPAATSREQAPAALTTAAAAADLPTLRLASVVVDSPAVPEAPPAELEPATGAGVADDEAPATTMPEVDSAPTGAAASESPAVSVRAAMPTPLAATQGSARTGPALALPTATQRRPGLGAPIARVPSVQRIEGSKAPDTGRANAATPAAATPNLPGEAQREPSEREPSLLRKSPGPRLDALVLEPTGPSRAPALPPASIPTGPWAAETASAWPVSSPDLVVSVSGSERPAAAPPVVQPDTSALVGDAGAPTSEPSTRGLSVVSPAPVPLFADTDARMLAQLEASESTRPNVPAVDLAVTVRADAPAKALPPPPHMVPVAASEPSKSLRLAADPAATPAFRASPAGTGPVVSRLAWDSTPGKRPDGPPIGRSAPPVPISVSQTTAPPLLPGHEHPSVQRQGADHGPVDAREIPAATVPVPPPAPRSITTDIQRDGAPTSPLASPPSPGPRGGAPPAIGQGPPSHQFMGVAAGPSRPAPVTPVQRATSQPETPGPRGAYIPPAPAMALAGHTGPDGPDAERPLPEPARRAPAVQLGATPLLPLRPLATAIAQKTPETMTHGAPDARLAAQRVERAVARPAVPHRLGPPAMAAWHDPAAAALASGAATLDTDGSVVFRTPEHLYPPAPAAAETIQRQAEPHAVTSAAAEPGPEPGTVPAPPSAAERSSEQLEDLAKRVYERISERLKTELRLDRERSGRLTDLTR